MGHQTLLQQFRAKQGFDTPWCLLLRKESHRPFAENFLLSFSSHSSTVKQWEFPFSYCFLSHQCIQPTVDCSFSLFLVFLFHTLALLVTKDRQTVSEAISKFMKNKRVIGDSQQGFTKHNSILTNSIAIYAEWLVLRTRGGQWIWYTLTLARPLTPSLTVYHRTGGILQKIPNWGK